MSFLQNDPASCGGSNAVNKFNQRANVDSSLQRQLQLNSQQQGAQGSFNKLGRVDHRLQREYESFGAQQGRQWDQGQPIQQDRLGVQSGHPDQRWVSDFQNMSINTGPQSQQGWKAEYIHRQGVQGPQGVQSVQQGVQGVQQGLDIQSQGQYYQSPAAMSSYQSMGGQYRQDLWSGSQSQSNVQSTVFESEFSAVEEELTRSNVQQDHPIQREQVPVEEPAAQASHEAIDESDKIRFAQIAQSVFNTMNTTPGVSGTTSDKFKNSNFMKLMDRVSKREVEINDDRDKFIDSKGHDIRDDLPDPLRDLRESDLRGPFESAKVVHEQMGDHLTSSAWETTL